MSKFANERLGLQLDSFSEAQKLQCGHERTRQKYVELTDHLDGHS